MKLLYTKRSPFARKVRVIALEKNIPLDLVDEDLQKKSQRLLEANPLGKSRRWFWITAQRSLTARSSVNIWMDLMMSADDDPSSGAD